MVKVLLVAALLLGSFGSAPSLAKTVIVRDDLGGNVLQYQARRRELAKADLVRLEGRCNSACTMFITLPNACLGPYAVFGFHGASPKTGIPQVDYFLDMQVGQFYRGEVRKRFFDKWRFHLGTRDLVYIKAETLLKWDPLLRVCPPRKKKG